MALPPRHCAPAQPVHPPAELNWPEDTLQRLHIAAALPGFFKSIGEQLGKEDPQ